MPCDGLQNGQEHTVRLSRKVYLSIAPEGVSGEGIWALQMLAISRIGTPMVCRCCTAHDGRGLSFRTTTEKCISIGSELCISSFDIQQLCERWKFLRHIHSLCRAPAVCVINGTRSIQMAYRGGTQRRREVVTLYGACEMLKRSLIRKIELEITVWGGQLDGIHPY